MPSFMGVVALASLLFVVAGVMIDSLSNVLFGAGLGIAGLFVLIYVYSIWPTDPRKKHYKSQ